MKQPETDKEVIERLGVMFPYIVKWGRMMQSFDYYIANELY